MIEQSKRMSAIKPLKSSAKAPQRILGGSKFSGAKTELAPMQFLRSPDRQTEVSHQPQQHGSKSLCIHGKNIDKFAMKISERSMRNFVQNLIHRVAVLGSGQGIFTVA